MSKLVSLRVPLHMLAELKEIADMLGRPYQAVMKEAISLGMIGLRPLSSEPKATRPTPKKRSRKPGVRTSYRAPHLDAAVARLKKTAHA